MKKNKDNFEFKYVAPTAEERKEIESIKNSYVEKPEIDKLSYLRSLDNKVKNTPTIVSLILGVLGLLIFGLGFSMVLEWGIILWGIIVGLLGVAIIIIAYPVYVIILKNLKCKYSEEIIKLSDDLLTTNDK